MKFTWELGDFRAGRRIWGSSNASNCECMIGYNERDHKGYVKRTNFDTNEEYGIADAQSDTRWYIVSQSDGAVYTSGKTKFEIIEWLNDNGYRPTTLEEGYMKDRLVVKGGRS